MHMWAYFSILGNEGHLQAPCTAALHVITCTSFCLCRNYCVCTCMCVCCLCEVGVLRGQMFPCRSLEELGKCVVMSFALVAWVQEREKKETSESEQQDWEEREKSTTSSIPLLIASSCDTHTLLMTCSVTFVFLQEKKNPKSFCCSGLNVYWRFNT